MPDEADSQKPTGDTDEHGSSVCPADTISEQKPEMGESGNGNSNHDQSDTKELSRQIHWVEKATLWSQIGLGVIGVTALFIYHGQLGVMQGTLDVMQRQLEITDRPWIKIVKAYPSQKLHFFDTEIIPGEGIKTIIGVRITMLVKNVGHSMALNVAMRGKMTFTIRPDLLAKEQADVCSGTAIALATFPLNIFLGDDSGDRLFIDDPQEVPSRSNLGSNTRSRIIASPVFIGCIVYTIPTTGSIRNSTFMYWLERAPDSPANPKSGLFELGVTVPEQELRVAPFLAGFDAN